MLWAEHVARNTARERDDVFGEVRRHFSDAQLVELTTVCGMFAMLNRFQDCLHLPLDPPSTVDKIRGTVRLDPVRIKGYMQLLIDRWPGAYPQAQKDEAAGHRPATEAPSPGNAAPAAACRVALSESKETSLPAQRWFAAVEALLGGVPNSVRIWAGLPYLGMMCHPIHVALEAEGAGCILPGTLKAAVLIRTSFRNAAPYSLAHYEASGRSAGLSDDRIETIKSDQAMTGGKLSPRESAALLWADHISANTARRNEDVFGRVQPHFNDAELVELTVLCTTTDMVNRVHNALRVPIEPPAEFAKLHRSNVLDPGRLKRYVEAILGIWPAAFPAADDERESAPMSA